MPYDLTSMWNLKEQNKQANKTKQKQTYSKQTGGYQREVGEGLGKYVKAIERYKIPVIK